MPKQIKTQKAMEIANHNLEVFFEALQYMPAEKRNMYLRHLQLEINSILKENPNRLMHTLYFCLGWAFALFIVSFIYYITKQMYA